MDFKNFAELALDNFDGMCYVVDIDTLELLYVNDNARAAFTPYSSTFIPGQKCHQFLHGKNEICSICNNHLLQDGQKLYTEIQNEKNKKYYSHIDSIHHADGRKLKLTFAFDATEQKKEIESLSRIISAEETLIECVHTLIEDNDLNTSILKLLSIVCQFYDADRAYLFEINQKNNTAKNIYEWCITPEIATIDDMPILSSEALKPILEGFNRDCEFSLDDVEKELDHNSELYKILHDTNCTSIQLVPIKSNNVTTYFMGVDNPKRDIKDLTLLQSVIIFVADDIKKSKTLKLLEHLSYTDVLTGLNNRNKYLERLEQLKPNSLNSLGYIHVNINALKKLNELYGEQYGDNVLKAVAQTLEKHIRKDLFRISGDEFIGLFPNTSHERFENVVLKIRKEVEDNKEFSFAIGAVWQDKKIDIRQGLTQAMDIMYSDKQNYYKSQVTDRVQSRSNPVEIILKEISNKQFYIVLQPKVYLSTGEIASAEALVRKFGTDGKPVSPDRFIPIYENEGTVRYLDFFVLEEVCKFLQKRIENENSIVPLAVNFSRVTFIAYDVIDEIVKTCAKYQIPHQFIKIELTESIDKMDFDFFRRRISNLRELGFEVSLDDFGAKHSNLLMLTLAEFSEVKIDKGLIDNITTSAENRTVVRNIIKTIKELGKSSCVAEGIETEEQVALLKDLGCTYGQGYYFYRPLPLDEFALIYDKHEKNLVSTTNIIGQSTRKNFSIKYDELYSILDSLPFCVTIWNHKRENVMCNDYAVKLFGLESKEEYLEKFLMLSPKYQPDGRLSHDIIFEHISEARNQGMMKINWMHTKLNGDEIPCEVTLVRLDVKSEDGDFLVAAYVRDLRPQLAGTGEAEWAQEYFFHEVSDKTLFNTISEIAAEFFWVYNNRRKTIQFFGKGRELLDLPTEKMDFPKSIIDRNIVTDAYLEKFMKFVKAMEDGVYYPVEVEFNVSGGDERYFRIDYKIIYDDDNIPLFCIGKTSDIHEKKSLEVLTQKN